MRQFRAAVFKDQCLYLCKWIWTSCWFWPAEVWPSEPEQPGPFLRCCKGSAPQLLAQQHQHMELLFPHVYIILSDSTLLILVVHSVLGLWTEIASGPVVFSKWVFLYQEMSATSSFENLICFHMEKNPLAPRMKKKRFCPHIFQWEKTNLASYVNISRIKTLFIFSLQIANAQEN